MSLSARRAWIEMALGLSWYIRFWSLSARRAWIEIYPPIGLCRERVVALRKESVDRNQNGRQSQNIKRRSLSARRAWIEMRLDFEY